MNATTHSAFGQVTMVLGRAARPAQAKCPQGQRYGVQPGSMAGLMLKALALAVDGHPRLNSTQLAQVAGCESRIVQRLLSGHVARGRVQRQHLNGRAHWSLVVEFQEEKSRELWRAAVLLRAYGFDVREPPGGVRLV